jgi:nucleoside-diphosphate-sugar epimerase
MNILITGGGGFLGQRVARALLAQGETVNAKGERGPIKRITLMDISEPPNGIKDPRVTFVRGEVSNHGAVAEALGMDTDGVFHLAAVVSGQAEADFELGMRVNLDGLRTVLEACRKAGNHPRVLFASSIAVFGTPLPDVITDSTTPTPQASYGVQKLIGEWLTADYNRKGFIDGRAVRIPTVSVRPGKANAAASSFASAVIREPLNGIDYGCPVPPETLMWMCSPAKVVANLVRAYELPTEAWGELRAVSLPGITVSVAEMVDSLRRLGGEAAAARVRYIKDDRIQAIVKTWAAKLDTPRALGMGFTADATMDEIVAQYIRDEGIKVPA